MKTKLEEIQDQISITNNAFGWLQDEREENLNVKKKKKERDRGPSRWPEE